MRTKITYSALLLFFALMASAQVSFGVYGGVNFQNMNGKNYSGDAIENTMIPGYHAGVNVQIPVAPEFYFQPGLLFSTKGTQHQGAMLTTTTKLSYVELPMNFVYKGLLGSGYVLVGVGPYVAYAINGKETIEGGSATLSTPVQFQNVVETNESLLVPYYKPLDVGGNIFIGYELASGIFAQLNAQLGMVDINPEYKIVTDDKTAIKNTGFGLSLGYRF